MLISEIRSHWRFTTVRYSVVSDTRSEHNRSSIVPFRVIAHRVVLGLLAEIEDELIECREDRLDGAQCHLILVIVG